jgi:squalene-hopene/tetraprenyl-beta-curcumene cyclase
MKLQVAVPPEDVRAAVNGLNTLQNSDGGWSQLPDRPSDAYATGQVLYALHLAEVAPDAEPILKGVQFLIRTQRDDGSWPMTRRTQTGETPSQNMIPITYFGSAWATLGLLRSLPEMPVTGQ